MYILKSLYTTTFGFTLTQGANFIGKTIVEAVFKNDGGKFQENLLTLSEINIKSVEAVDVATVGLLRTMAFSVCDLFSKQQIREAW